MAFAGLLLRLYSEDQVPAAIRRAADGPATTREKRKQKPLEIAVRLLFIHLNDC
jgi:uncharacterized protein (UPF0147 family)